jgi:uncharacterized membrane protein YgcG
LIGGRYRVVTPAQLLKAVNGERGAIVSLATTPWPVLGYTNVEIYSSGFAAAINVESQLAAGTVVAPFSITTTTQIDYVDDAGAKNAPPFPPLTTRNTIDVMTVINLKSELCLKSIHASTVHTAITRAGSSQAFSIGADVHECLAGGGGGGGGGGSGGGGGGTTGGGPGLPDFPCYFLDAATMSCDKPDGAL